MTPVASTSQQAMLERGIEVGQIATRRYSNGNRIGHQGHHTKAVKATKVAMKDQSIHAIFEAAFEYQGVRIRVDILERQTRGRWNLIEVKSSTDVKEIHHKDVAVQVYVVEGCGLKLADAGLLHLNKKYTLRGSNLYYQNLFKFESLQAEVHRIQNKVKSNIKAFRKILKTGKEPGISPGRHCYEPYDCPYQSFCIEPRGPYSPLRLPGGKALTERLASHGITDVRNIPSTVKLNPLQRRAQRAQIQNREYVGPQLRRHLENVTFPIHFVDFETFMPAIPRYSGTRPYQALPCQWSDHVMDASGRINHKAFLHDDDSDPREPFIKSLLKILGTVGSICVYSSYEKTQLKKIAKAFPAYKSKIDAVLDRLWDLMAIIKKHYYHPGFAGSFSIKAVLPALTSITYDDLDIHSGEEAATAYERMIAMDKGDSKREDVRKALHCYCKQDTYAMLEVREELLKRC